MKKLLLIFTFLTAFAVNGFAYSESKSFMLYEVGYMSESITMNCEHLEFHMGAMSPGFVEVYGYRSDGGPTLYAKVDYTQYGFWRWSYPIYGCQINIAVSSLVGGSGIYLDWW